MLRRVLTVVISGALASVLCWTAVAAAQAYGSGVSVSDVAPAPGSQVTVVARGLPANRDAEVLLDSMPLASTSTDANGTANRVVTIPATTTLGEHVVTVAHVRPNGRKITLSTALDVRTGGSALQHSDGRGVTALVIVSLLAVALATPLVLRRRASHSNL